MNLCGHAFSRSARLRNGSSKSLVQRKSNCQILIKSLLSVSVDEGSSKCCCCRIRQDPHYIEQTIIVGKLSVVFITHYTIHSDRLEICEGNIYVHYKHLFASKNTKEVTREMNDDR